MSDIATQYRIISNGAGWARRVDRGRLLFEGRDRVAFLQALLTNEIAALREGAGTYALYLTPQGRLIADLHVFIRPQAVIADVPAASAEGLATTFDRLVFAEDVRISDQSSSVLQLTVAGGGAPSALARALAVAEADVRDLAVWSQLACDGGFLVRTDDIAEGSWDVICPVDQADSVAARLDAAGAAQVSGELLDSLRIEDGRPQFGVDMTTETIPLEAGLLDRAISQTKGCYVGQEVIIRVLHRGGGRVARKLVRLDADRSNEDPVPSRGSDLMRDGQTVGRLTSAAVSARSGRLVGLGYVARESAEAGRTVGIAVPDRPPISATITDLAG